jgi:hypothetical protein
MPVGDRDHRRIAMAPPARLAGRGHQRLNLGAGETLPGAVPSQAPACGRLWRFPQCS